MNCQISICLNNQNKLDYKVAIDGLTLHPAANFSIVSRTLTISPTAISGSPAGISKVYNFSEPVNFVGNVGFFFQQAQLNGNTENTLQLSYGTQTFVTTINSTVDVNQHYVFNDLPVLTSFASVTAAQEGALPMVLVSFHVAKSENEALLQWQTTSEVNNRFFEIKQSSDAKRWNILGQVREPASISVFDVSRREYYRSSRLQPVSEVGMKEFPAGIFSFRLKNGMAALK